jgi:hypothetical protein
MATIYTIFKARQYHAVQRPCGAQSQAQGVLGGSLPEKQGSCASFLKKVPETKKAGVVGF